MDKVGHPDMSRPTMGERTDQDGTVIPSAGTEPEHTPLTALRFVRHLGDDFHRGNVIATKKKKSMTFKPITRAAADRLPRGRRGQRNGLIYHAGYEGFDPESWQVVVRAHESVRLVLAPPVNGAPPTVVDIQRTPATTDARLFETTAFAIDEHELVRKDDGVGGMVGIGDHLAYDGEMHPFVMKDEQKRGLLAHRLHFASEQFSAHFAGRSVGWEEMLLEQAELWPNPKPRGAKCWDASQDLGNACHTDRDGARSFAVWLRAKPDGCACGWYFLFPEHGVAVVLAHGTWMSWDGRVQPHCSAVPCVPEGDRLLSLFASLPANLCSVFEREQACGAAVAARQARDADPAYHKTVGSGSAEVFQELDIGTPVMLRWVPEAPAGLGRMGKRRWGQSHFRWVACKVVALDRVRWTVEVREVASPYWVHPRLSASEVYNRLIVGHY